MNIDDINPYLYNLFVKNGYKIPTGVYMNGWEYNILRQYEKDLNENENKRVIMCDGRCRKQLQNDYCGIYLEGEECPACKRFYERNENMILIVNSGARESFIGQLDIDNGSYKPYGKIKGSLEEQANLLVSITLREIPSQIIIDKIGFGIGLYDLLVEKLESFDTHISQNGTLGI